MPKVSVNPEVLSKSGFAIVEESCLSAPDDVIRAAKIRVAARGVMGQPFERDCDGMEAVSIQREIDHLDGKVLIDRVSFLEKLRLPAFGPKTRRGAGVAASSVRPVSNGPLPNFEYLAERLFGAYSCSVQRIRNSKMMLRLAPSVFVPTVLLWTVLLWSVLCAGLASAALADKVDRVETVRLGALDLKGRHLRPEGAGLETVLIVHTTLEAYSDRVVVALQDGLAAEGFASLAINLSLGQSGREGPLDCKATHTHRHEDALAEIDAWTNWLMERGLGPVVLAGHGRGGAQAAWMLARRGKARFAAGVLLAPTGWTPRQADAEYRARYSDGLAALLTRIARLKPADVLENVPFLHCGAVAATKASIVSYYGPEPMRDAPTALAEVKTPTLVIEPEFAAFQPEDDVADRLAKLQNPAIVVRALQGADARFLDGSMDQALKAVDAYLRSVLAE